jgi:hypothetical protein
MEVAKTLKLIREELGFDSAKAFYRDYLSERTRLDFNYTYYMKIEGGKVVPSPNVVNVVSSALEKNEADRLILSYCETLFPARAGLFKKQQIKSKKTALNEKSSEQTSQRFLTDRQVATVAKTREHYFIFLILTLAREPIMKALLESYVGGIPNSSALQDLAQAKLVRQDQDRFASISNEMRFPKASSPAQTALYEKIDLWNLEFEKFMKFKSVLQKMHLRRISPRYLDVISAHCALISDLVKSSDEVDPNYNDEVLMLTISLSQGKLPG